jgi:hypothetical protein
MNRILLCVAALGGLTVLPRHAHAQRRVVSAEVTVGQSTGRGGAYGGDRSGLALDGLVSTRVIGPGAFHAILGAGGGLEGPNAKSNNCLREPTAGCVPDFPRIYTLGLFLGVEHVGRFGDVRLMTGPTNFRASGGGSALGVQARLQLATPPVRHVQLVGSARGGFAWNLDRQDIRLGAVGIGLGLR